MLALLPACSAILDFKQCDVDSDCLRFKTGDTAAYCTADRICVSDFPNDRLCTVDKESSTLPDAITIAGLFRLSGPNEVEDTDIANAVSLAVSEVNQQGKRAVRLVRCDTGGDADQARKALTRAVEGYGAVAGVGPTSSGEVVALARDGDSLVTRFGFLLVSCSATSPTVTALADQGLVWRTAASDNLQAQVLGDILANRTMVTGFTTPPTRVADAFIDSVYGSGLNTAFINALGTRFTSPSLVPVATKAFAEGTPGTDVVKFLEDNTPQVALIVADSDAPTWIAAFNDGGAAVASTKILMTDGSKSTSLFSMTPNKTVLDRIVGTAPATPTGPAFNTFKTAYQGRYDNVDPGATAFVSNAYDALYVIALASAVVPDGVPVTGRALVAGMKMLSDPMGMSITHSEFARGYAAIANMQPINFEGTSGPVDFDPDTGDIYSAPIEIWNVDTTGATPKFRTLQNVTP